MSEPLKAAEWHFPLGAATARLTITAQEGAEITPEDMDALIEIAGIFKAQLERRAPKPSCTVEEK